MKFHNRLHASANFMSPSSKCAIKRVPCQKHVELTGAIEDFMFALQSIPGK